MHKNRNWHGGKVEVPACCEHQQNQVIHPGKLTWNTIWWRFGSDDFPLVWVVDFTVISKFYMNFQGCTSEPGPNKRSNLPFFPRKKDGKKEAVESPKRITSDTAYVNPYHPWLIYGWLAYLPTLIFMVFDVDNYTKSWYGVKENPTPKIAGYKVFCTSILGIWNSWYIQ